MIVPLLLAASLLSAQPPRPMTAHSSQDVRSASTRTSSTRTSSNRASATNGTTLFTIQPDEEEATQERTHSDAHRDAHRRHEHHGHRHGHWRAWRFHQSAQEVRVSGPGALTAISPPDAFDEDAAGTWQLTAVQVVSKHDDGYGRIAPAIDVHLGWLTIGSDGHFEWDLPGETAAQGEMTEVTGSDASSDEHFWSLRGHGRTVVIAGGQNGELLLYDASTNQLIATAQK